nr:helix-turn-helix domain-containing protein [uncultured Sphaerochaeta sp.]
MKSVHPKFSILLILFFISILIVLVVSVYSFLHLFETTTEKQLLSYGKIALDSDVLYIDTITNSVRNVFNSISFDSEISKLLNYESVHPIDLHIGLQRLESYVESNFFIDSIYVYNRNKNMVYVASPNAVEAVYTPEGFYDDNALQLMQHYSSYKNMEPIFRTIDVTYPFESKASFISFMRYNMLKQDEQSNVMMINIRQDILSKLISSVPENNGRLLLITDRKGWHTIVAGNRWNYSDQLIETVILALETKENSFVLEADPRKYIVCFQSVMNSRLSIVLIADENDMSSITQTNEYTHSILLLSLLFAVCLIAGALVLKRIFTINRVHRETLANLEKEKCELSYEKKRRQILAFFENHPPSTMTETEIQTMYRTIGVDNIDGSSVFLIVFFINAYCSEVPLTYERVKDRNMLKHNICETASALMSRFQVLLTAFDDAEKCFLVVDGDSKIEAIQNSLQDVNSAITKKFGIISSIFISGECDFLNLASAYEELEKALPYRRLYESGSIVTTEMIDVRELNDCTISEDLLRRISQHILQLDMDTALLELRELIMSISNGSYKSFQINLLQLAVALDEILHKLQSNNGIEKTINLDTLLFNLSSFETLDSLYVEFETAILQAEKLITQNKNSHQASLITEMQEIITNEYSSKDFSIITVSEKIGMNASYLGKMFKRNTGMTFIECLHKERMNAACHLLATTKMQIGEIVSAVGFSDAPYFYKVFKRENGCTPNTYRQQHQQNNS